MSYHIRSTRFFLTRMHILWLVFNQKGEMKTTKNQALRQDLHRAGLRFDETKIYSAAYSPPFAILNRSALILVQAYVKYKNNEMRFFFCQKRVKKSGLHCNYHIKDSSSFSVISSSFFQRKTIPIPGIWSPPGKRCLCDVGFWNMNRIHGK
jgi:hypothetical protein